MRRTAAGDRPFVGAEALGRAARSGPGFVHVVSWSVVRIVGQCSGVEGAAANASVAGRSSSSVRRAALAVAGADGVGEGAVAVEVGRPRRPSPGRVRRSPARTPARRLLNISRKTIESAPSTTASQNSSAGIGGVAESRSPAPAGRRRARRVSAAGPAGRQPAQRRPVRWRAGPRGCCGPQPGRARRRGPADGGAGRGRRGRKSRRSCRHPGAPRPGGPGTAAAAPPGPPAGRRRGLRRAAARWAASPGGELPADHLAEELVEDVLGHEPAG